MARDTRPLPRGLIAPLSQAALGALRSFHEGSIGSIPDIHRARLLDLALIEERGEGVMIVTSLGQQRLISDR